MAISARNCVKGKVKNIKKGQVMAEVTVELSPNVEIVSVVTENSINKLGIEVGKDINVVIKATSVLLDA
ncbi:TOBE domain-containing protein [Desulfogranum japonicum]|uniref:TOBE domain-containing protein n=1 Tax=Desulfogranum japonicum TaxID=231447 RepID=UPI0004251E7A|nr:TOBE domain-containing protein [Desulfogranum japonicum]